MLFLKILVWLFTGVLYEHSDSSAEMILILSSTEDKLAPRTGMAGRVSSDRLGALGIVSTPPPPPVFKLELDPESDVPRIPPSVELDAALNLSTDDGVITERCPPPLIGECDEANLSTDDAATERCPPLVGEWEEEKRSAATEERCPPLVGENEDNRSATTEGRCPPLVGEWEEENRSAGGEERCPPRVGEWEENRSKLCKFFSPKSVATGGVGDDRDLALDDEGNGYGNPGAVVCGIELYVLVPPTPLPPV